MTDKIEFIGKSLIQYGRENNRIYLMKLAIEDYPVIFDTLDKLATEYGYTKIIGKIPTQLKDEFIKKGFEQEAYVKKFFNGKEDVSFMSKYFTEKRQCFENKNDILRITQFCIEKANLSTTRPLDDKFKIKQLGKDHISQMVEIYKSVFESYPFPIFDCNYILETMSNNVDYYGVFEGEKIIALSSSEMDLVNSNTEMTDFAVLDDYRGNNLSYHLLKKMQKDATIKGIKTAYTIARAQSTGINMIFAKMFYEFGGTLVNNTNICGNLESMNVWYKNLF